MNRLVFPTTSDAALRGAETVLLLAPARCLKEGWLAQAVGDRPWRRLLERAAKETEPGRRGRAVTTLNPDAGPGARGGPRKVVLGVLPDTVSRHNAPSRSDFVGALAAAADLGSASSAVIACLEDPSHALPLATAVARTLPVFSRAGGKAREKSTPVAFLGLTTSGRPVALSDLEEGLVARTRWAASLVDTPTQEMDAAAFERAVRAQARGIRGVKVTSIVGPELLARGLGGIHGVGRAAVTAPRLLLLEYSPPRARRRLGLVGKGVVYDTGGLALKPRDGMVGMKADMAGAAAVMAAALALAASKHPDAILAAAPLAENAIGPGAFRNDDILTLHSGKTVEINNTDAEGRLLLADAVSYLARVKKADVVIDAATLTGAQLIATGVRHAAIVSNRAGLEALALEAGRDSGDLAWPLPFAPEIFQEEFRSKVADMKNSVASRTNAQSSCAAQFVWSHVDDLDVPWLHVDLAGPAFREDRATGYGVALLGTLAGRITERALKA